jgi:hypothetical protein
MVGTLSGVVFAGVLGVLILHTTLIALGDVFALTVASPGSASRAVAA